MRIRVLASPQWLRKMSKIYFVVVLLELLWDGLVDTKFGDPLWDGKFTILVCIPMK
jgi:hypothetical protein